jgi:hypothetical protein
VVEVPEPEVSAPVDPVSVEEELHAAVERSNAAIEPGIV